MHEQSEPPPTTSDDRITRALPYIVGLLVAFGLLIYNSTQGSSGNGDVASADTVAAAASGRRVPIADVRRALDSSDYDDVDVGEYAGTIILTGSVADDSTRQAAGAAADEAAGGTPVDNRLVITGTGGSNGGGTDGDAAGVPVTAAASTVPPAAMDTTAATPSPAPPTTAVPETAVAPVLETTAGPETTAVPESTVMPAPESAAPQPAPPVTDTAAPAPPEPSADELNARLSELLKADPVQFEKLASRIETSSFGTLDQAVAVILSSPTARFEVQGHTDSGGQPSFNQRLSEQRANSVRTYLVDHGVPADRLAAVGYGETRPVARNATPEGRSLNRRVEIVVIP